MKIKKINYLKLTIATFLLVFIVTLCFSLTGCGGNKAFEGSWKTAPADNEKLKNSDIVKNLGSVLGNEESGSYYKNALSDAFSMTLTLEGGLDNKAKLEIVGLSQDGNWKSSSPNEGELTIGKTKASMSREGDKITLSNGNVSIDFYKQ